MKRIIKLALILCVMSIPALPAEPTENVQRAVLAAEKDWKSAVLKADGGALNRLLSADLSYTHSSSKTQTKEQFIQDVTSGATVYKSIDFENTKLRQYGEVVVLTQSAVITSVPVGTSRLYLTEVWAREKGSWQMVSRQATKLP